MTPVQRRISVQFFSGWGFCGAADTADWTAIAGPVIAGLVSAPFDQRASKRINGTATAEFPGAYPARRRRNGLNPVQEQSSRGSVTANLLTGLNIDESFARTASGTTSTFLADALGSTIGLVIIILTRS